MGSSGRVANKGQSDRGWARNVARQVGEPVKAVAVRVARESGLDIGETSALLGFDADPELSHAFTCVGDPAGGWTDPWLVGEVHEYAVSGGERRRRGAWYTPRGVARELVELTVEAAGAARFTADPCCGGGGFLLAAADSLASMSLSAEEVLTLLGGHDIDPGAVEATRWALGLWAASHGVPVAEARRTAVQQVTVADSLDHVEPTWPGARLIVGNPPFGSPLKQGSVSSAALEYREQNADDLGPYADQAFFHLHRAVSTCESGSVVTLVQPQSLLASRDARSLRGRLSQMAALKAMWVTRRAVFDAGTRVCAPVLAVGGTAGSAISLVADGRTTEVPCPSLSPSEAGTVDDGSELGVGPNAWAPLAARALGAPSLPSGMWKPATSLSSMARATAGFRDEYYGLARAAKESDVDGEQHYKRLVTVGSVEPLVTTWGCQPVRIAGKRWLRPVVDVESLDGKVRRWTEEQLQPKVVLATQSKVLEPVVDPRGDFVPLTPLVSVFCDPSDLLLVTAVLLAPPIVNWAWQQTFGTAMSVDALKLAAREVGTLPLPSDRRLWEEAASVLEAELGNLGDGDLTKAWATANRVGQMMTRAYGAERDVSDWWLARAKKAWVTSRPVD